MSSNQDSTVTQKQGAMVQIALRIPPELHKTIGHLAVDRGVTANWLWIEAMRAYLKRNARTDAA